ncbi:HNH endonuclease signature motif containing protein [Mesorhizobium sp.]|uniref:HNH endonuclease signature motif containing protein n=1 Tax=Mesorhizobium sp. TaxID=1871066 RepID=UPI003BAB2996
MSGTDWEGKSGVVKFIEVAPTPDVLMGVKAVWGRSSEPVMCFGSHGNAALKDRAHFSLARTTAERSVDKPYFLTIGGGDQVPDDLRGRVLELVRSTGVYGETTAFVRDDELKARLAQWPVAVIISEVYSVVGEPRLIQDLGQPDHRILTNAFDRVKRDDAQIRRLWETLKDREIERRWEIQLPSGFRDPGRVQMFGSMYPRLASTSSEGKRVWKLQREMERDAALARAAKASNRARNGGVIICEACGYSDSLSMMFDAHHRSPLSIGPRETRMDDLAVLCPTCHRWSHAKAEDKLSPIPVHEIAEAMRLQGST